MPRISVQISGAVECSEGRVNTLVGSNCMQSLIEMHVGAIGSFYHSVTNLDEAQMG